MKLVIGLGNPGKEYEKTRHNAGFSALELFADKIDVEFNREDFKGRYAKFKLDDEPIILFEPLTYMNLSGHAVREVVNFFKVKLEDIVVVFDDMALAPGTIRLRLKGSSGGQKGMQNIIEQLGSEEIKRIRIGIGEPEFDAIDYVLGRPKDEEKEAFESGIRKAAKAIECFIYYDFLKAMTNYNGGGDIERKTT